MAEGEDMAEVSTIDLETTCSKCYAEFLDPEDLTVHMKQVHLPENSPRCHFCPAMFSGLEDYALHLRNIHILSMKSCKYCAKVFTDYNAFRKHQNKHIRERSDIMSCSQCNARFPSIHDLKQHEGQMHDNSIDGVYLNDQLALLSSCLNIKAIDFIQSLGQDAAYICRKCALKTSDPYEYIQHLNNTNCTSIVCNSCCNVYKDRRGLIKHMENHKECSHIVDKQDLSKTCPKCNKIFDLFSFTDHVKKCKPMSCNLCNIKLLTMEEMTYHQATKHPMAIMMTKCKFCHREFVGNTALMKHIDRKHKPQYHLYKYMCVHCEDMYFTHPTKLFGHFFSTHRDVQPYSCTICNITFRVRKKFTFHIKLTHNSVGFVEFDTRYHVFFTANKSANPFVPKSLFANENENVVNDVEAEKDDLLNAQTDAPTDVPTDIPTDVPTDVPTDGQTDTEEIRKTTGERKPAKLRFKEMEKSKGNKSFTIKKEIQSEGNQTENDAKENIRNTRGKSRLAFKQKRAKRKKRQAEIAPSDSEDEPLIKVKRTINMSRRGIQYNTKKHESKKSKRRFTCNVCKKYCYTFQHYNHHMSLHFKDEEKKCIKCSRKFSSKTALNKHVAEKHSTSKLTETLKSLLERRKMGKNGVRPDIPTSEKFKRTIKEVKTSSLATPAIITEVNDKLSVKNFIETFTPEEREESTKKVKPEIQASVTIRKIDSGVKRPPAIKLTKFIPKPPPTNVKLAMPIRFKPVNSEKPKIRVKIVQNVYNTYNEDADNVDNDYGYDYELQSESKNDIVPDMAQEVMLESQEQVPLEKKARNKPHKIVIPKLPKDYNERDIKIAHLLPVAPFYKIVKMKDVLEQKPKIEDEDTKDKLHEQLELPGGTKLVNVNPLAHLIGNTPVEKIIGPSNKHYKPKTDNFEKAIAKALLKMEQAPKRRKPTGKNKAKEVAEEAIEALVDESSIEIEQ